MSRPSKKTPRDAAGCIKLQARRLFATRGIAGVTVREIAKAADQKNHRAVGYYFGSKEALVHQIIIDGAIVIDGRRNRMLDEMESKGGPGSVREVVDALIYPSLHLEEGGTGEDSYISFLNVLHATYHEFVIETLAGSWNTGYERCLQHLRKLMPPMPENVREERFMFVKVLCTGVLAMRERALSGASAPREHSSSDELVEHLIRTVTALLKTPFSERVDASS